MIYLISKQTSLFSERYNIITVEESFNIINNLGNIRGLDTETTGLNPHQKELLTVQIGNKGNQVVIDCTTIDISLYKDILEDKSIVYILANAKFDIQFFFKHNIILSNVWDVMLAEQILNLGYPRDSFHADLKTLEYKYLGIHMDKSVRGKITKVGLTEEVIVYAANDVVDLPELRNQMLKSLEKEDLVTSINIENKFVIPLAYMEWCGVRLDVDKWKQKMERDQAELDKALQEMCDWVVKNDPTCPYIYRNLQGDLFSGFDTTPKLNINWNSPKQVIDLFKRYNVSVEVEDKGKSKDSVNAKSLAPQSSKCGLIPIYLKFKEQAKLVGTYGENVLGQINKNTGRLYTKYNVKGTDTFRVSSGGTDGNTKYINMLNIPADSFTRSCFIAEPNNRWISIDYSGQESFLMASIANDKAMIHELMEGEGDLHTLTAKIVYPEIPKDMPANEVKQKFHKLRSEAKGYEFGFNYGGTAHTIMRNFGLSKTRAEEIERLYMSGFSGLKRYQDWRREDWKKKGYIDLNPIFGFKAFIYDYNYLVNLGSKFDDPEYKAYYHEMKSIDPNCSVVMDRKDYYKRLSESDRQSINYPIQHSGALCSMVAQIIFFNTLRAKDWLFKVLITVCPYDEINCEAPNEIAEEVTTLLYNCMVKAGSYFCTRCKLDADISRDSNGELPTYWIH